MFKHKLMFKIIALITIQTFVFSSSATAYSTLDDLSKVERKLRVVSAHQNKTGEEVKIDLWVGNLLKNPAFTRVFGGDEKKIRDLAKKVFSMEGAITPPKIEALLKEDNNYMEFSDAEIKILAAQIPTVMGGVLIKYKGLFKPKTVVEISDFLTAEEILSTGKFDYVSGTDKNEIQNRFLPNYFFVRVNKEEEFKQASLYNFKGYYSSGKEVEAKVWNYIPGTGMNKIQHTKIPSIVCERDAQGFFVRNYDKEVFDSGEEIDWSRYEYVPNSNLQIVRKKGEPKVIYWRRGDDRFELQPTMVKHSGEKWTSHTLINFGVWEFVPGDKDTIRMRFRPYISAKRNLQTDCFEPPLFTVAIQRGGEKQIEALIQILFSNKSQREERLEAIRCLKEIGSSEAIENLAKIFEPKNRKLLSFLEIALPDDLIKNPKIRLYLAKLYCDTKDKDTRSLIESIASKKSIHSHKLNDEIFLAENGYPRLSKEEASSQPKTTISLSIDKGRGMIHAKEIEKLPRTLWLDLEVKAKNILDKEGKVEGIKITLKGNRKEVEKFVAALIVPEIVKLSVTKGELNGLVWFGTAFGGFVDLNAPESIINQLQSERAKLDLNISTGIGLREQLYKLTHVLSMPLSKETKQWFIKKVKKNLIIVEGIDETGANKLVSILVDKENEWVKKSFANLNLAMMKGEIVHREEGGVNEAIEKLFAEGKMVEFTKEARRDVENYLNRKDVKNKFSCDHQGDLLLSNEGIRYWYAEDDSPALVLENKENYQIAHVGLKNESIYFSRTIKKLKDTKPEFYYAFLIRELQAYTRASYRGRILGYEEAVKEGEHSAETVEKKLVLNRLDKFIQGEVDDFLEKEKLVQLYKLDFQIAEKIGLISVLQRWGSEKKERKKISEEIKELKRERKLLLKGNRAFMTSQLSPLDLKIKALNLKITLMSGQISAYNMRAKNSEFRSKRGREAGVAGAVLVGEMKALKPFAADLILESTKLKKDFLKNAGCSLTINEAAEISRIVREEHRTVDEAGKIVARMVKKAAYSVEHKKKSVILCYRQSGVRSLEDMADIGEIGREIRDTFKEVLGWEPRETDASEVLRMVREEGKTVDEAGKIVAKRIKEKLAGADANLAKKKGEIVHREEGGVNEAVAKLFAEKKMVQFAKDARESVEIYLNSKAVRNKLSDDEINDLLSLNQQVEFWYAEEDLPALVLDDNENYQTAHIGMRKKRIYFSSLIQKIRNTSPELYKAFLVTELAKLSAALSLGNTAGYDEAVNAGEDFGGRIEKKLVANRLDDFIQNEVDNFLEKEFQMLVAAISPEADFVLNQTKLTDFEDKDFSRALIINYQLLLHNPSLALAIVNAKEQLGDNIKFVLAKAENVNLDVLCRNIKKATCGRVDLENKFDLVTDVFAKPEEVIKQVERELQVERTIVIGPEYWAGAYQVITDNPLKNCAVIVCQLGKDNEFTRGDIALLSALNRLVKWNILSDEEKEKLTRQGHGELRKAFFIIPPGEMQENIKGAHKRYRKIASSG